MIGSTNFFLHCNTRFGAKKVRPSIRFGEGFEVNLTRREEKGREMVDVPMKLDYGVEGDYSGGGVRRKAKGESIK